MIIKASGQPWRSSRLSDYKNILANCVVATPATAVKPEALSVFEALEGALLRKLELRKSL